LLGPVSRSSSAATLQCGWESKSQLIEHGRTGLTIAYKRQRLQSMLLWAGVNPTISPPKPKFKVADHLHARSVGDLGGGECRDRTIDASPRAFGLALELRLASMRVFLP
jgi:hypothetical protein